MLLLLNESGDPSFLFPNLSPYTCNINNQWAKFDKNPRAGLVLFQWNDLNVNFNMAMFQPKLKQRLQGSSIWKSIIKFFLDLHAFGKGVTAAISRN